METAFLKPLFIIILMFSTVDLLTLEDYRNCSLASGRLTIDTVVPIRFDVKLIMDPQNGILSGKTDIIIQIKKQTTNITLHARDLQVDMPCTIIMKSNAKPRCSEADAEYRLWEIVHCTEAGVVNMIFSDFISPGRYILHIEHSSISDKNINNLIYPYTWTGNETRWLVTNLFRSHAIRRLFPNWDNWTIKVYLHISLKHNTSYKIISNVDEWYSYEAENVRRTFFTEIKPISTHFTTFIIAPDIMTNVEQYDINYFWKESNVTQLLEYGHTVAYHITLYFKLNLNITLSKILKKINHFVLPICPMKSAGRFGLIAYREKDVTYNKDLDAPSRRIDIAMLISYEMVRQLFVSIINPQLDIEDKWLDEILASFYSFYLLEKIWGGDDMMELFVVQNLQTALDSDIYLELKPIIHKTKNDVGIDGLLYPLLYHKKAFALIRMLFHLLTPRKFEKVIKEYAQLRTNVDFWTIVDEVCPRKNNKSYTIKEIMDSWLTEIHHPEMHFYRDYEKKIFKYNVTSSNKVSKFKIPFTYATTSSLRFYNTINVTWYKGNKTKVITGPDDIYHFLLVNMEQVGYYRVNYDNRNWQLLSDYLQSNSSIRIPVLNRAQIVNDAFYFTIKKKIDSELFYDIVKFLKNETEYIPWYPMFNIMSYMSNYLKNSFGIYMKARFKYMLDIFLNNVGYEERKFEKDTMTPLRLLAIRWACKFGHTGCRNAVAEKLIAYLHNNELNIISRWTNWMYCTGMMAVNMTIWKEVLQESIQDKNMKLLEHLSCSEDEDIILYYLNFILNDRTEAELHMGKIYRSIVKKHTPKRKVRNYLLDNINKTLTRFPNVFSYETLICDIIMNVYSKSQIQQIASKLFNNYEMWIKVQSCSDIRRNQLTKLKRKFTMF